jgi:hypothetical protein
MPPSIAIDFDSFSIAYNIWLDKASEFTAEFSDHVEMYTISNLIVRLLNTNLAPTAENEDHPFYKYAADDLTFNDIEQILRADVLSEVQGPPMRGYVASFFHHGGVNYDDLRQLIKDYIDFAGRSEDPDWAALYRESDGALESDDESDFETEYGEDEMQEGDVPPPPASHPAWPPVDPSDGWGDAPVSPSAEDVPLPPAEWIPPSDQESWAINNF